MLGRGFGAIDAGTPFDDIEIDLDNPPLAPGQLDQRREIGLESLAEPSAARPQKHVLRGLHRDRAGPQQSAAPALVLLPGYLDPAPVEAEMPAEALVVASEHGADQRWRHVVERLPVLAYALPLARSHQDQRLHRR